MRLWLFFWLLALGIKLRDPDRVGQQVPEQSCDTFHAPILAAVVLQDLLSIHKGSTNRSSASIQFQTLELEGYGPFR